MHHNTEPTEDMRHLLKNLQTQNQALETSPRKEKIGATGQFPNGKLHEKDAGEIRFNVVADKERGLIHLDFGKPIANMSANREQVLDLIQALQQAAERLEEEKIFGD